MQDLLVHVGVLMCLCADVCEPLINGFHPITEQPQHIGTGISIMDLRWHGLVGCKACNLVVLGHDVHGRLPPSMVLAGWISI